MSMRTKAKHPYFVDFNRLTETVLGYREAKPLLVALHYDLFTWIARGFDTAESLSVRLGLDLRATRILLNAIASLGYLKKRANTYRNTREARRLLVADSPEYVGNSLKYQEMIWDAWSDLKRVLKEGKPREALLDWIRKDFFTKDYIKAMGDVSREPARELAGKLKLGAELQKECSAVRVLDVGSGAGNFSAAFVEAEPAVQATLLDLPNTLAIARELLSGHPRAVRFAFREANYLKDPLGESEFDLVLISNVTRVEDEKTNRMLVAKAFDALRPGGRLVIHDYVTRPDRTGPKFSALLGLHLLLFTGKGEVYTTREYAGWLRKAGFRGIRVMRIAQESLHPSCAVVGRKP